MMTGGRELLLLLAVIPLLVRCQQKPTVSMSPNLTRIFTGDVFYLHCDDGQSGSAATWSVNGSQLQEGNKTLKIAAACPSDSGVYACTINSQGSDELTIKVHGYVPIASLTIRTGHPVMRKNGKVLLELTNDAGLEGWSCRVNRGKTTKRVVVKLRDSPTSFNFESYELIVPETIYWCINKDENYRSNQVILRTTENEVTLEMYPFPAIAGEKMTLRCLVWGTDEVSNSVFYKEDSIVTSVTGATYEIRNVMESTKGRYKCEATYRHKAQTIKPSHKYYSDAQDVLVHVCPIRAHLSDNMWCSCPSCDSSMPYRYYKQNGNSWTLLGPDERPNDDGTYCCRAVSGYMRTLPSNFVRHKRSISVQLVVILVVILLLGLLILLAAFYMWNKRRHAAVDIYEQVPMRPTLDPNYELLNVKQVKEGEYDALQPGAEGRQKIGGEYEALAKQEGKDQVYHTLGENVASGGGDGGYEALKTAGIQKDEYDTLKTKQAEGGAGTESGGDGGYEALKMAGIQKDEYDTLKTKQAEWGAGTESGGDGGYEALKTAGIQKDEYDTLKTKQADKSE